ncbi:MAG: 6,7-dimethyl-8-ribityllumazine synthase [Bacteriovoracaceae bacterium]|nr:6,7-dimethyl-8-ribityllumazine synthase [Bacteriovoracaceae bacterium]
MKLVGRLNAENLNIAIVVSRFNDFITNPLCEGAKDCLYRHGLSEKNLTEVWVPGAFEIPLAAKTLAATKQYDAIICLGAIIRGSTAHFDHVASAATSGIAQVNQESGIPTIFGVLTTDTIEQAIERAGTKAGNKGWESALTAIEMANVLNMVKER